MDDESEISLKSICCTCLSIDRKLAQLSRVHDGVNKLFFLLSYDSDAYEALFHKDAVNLYICWECKALMNKLCEFRNQACIAQKQLTDITDGKINLKSKRLSLSRLSPYHQTTYNKEYIANDETVDNFIDCGPDIDFIKTESDNDDIPLCDLQINDISYDKEPLLKIDTKLKINTATKSIKENRKKDKTKEVLIDESKYSKIEMLHNEMIKIIEESKESRSSLDSYVNASDKCEICIEGFRNYNELEKHNLELHVEKQGHIQCDICMVYIEEVKFTDHRNEHFQKYICNICDNVTYNLQDLARHLEVEHLIGVATKKIKKKVSKTNEPKLKGRKTSKEQSLVWPCTECDQNFDSKNKKYKHVQKFHREWFKCSTCDKKFAFKNTLKRHELVHGTRAREQCAACGKLVRADLRLSHARTHAPRAPHDCRACGKRFVSRASYENHLKYSSRHAVTDVHKYKCTMCEKGYRSQAELRDHVNYQHMGRTRHKCPICDKALASPRCITRHVRRAHHGVKENEKDKICQTCGKAFREKKSLREHELIHSGERPLSCELCGRAFRQRASLYTHRRRVHRVPPAARRPPHALIND
ncbi:unnamed protein product [Euphydryas editha]|uniref:C2H2-type domain-containing protein n=1 Tax=Euphydryas editha TaxID=104508 RepID=A0AAU9T9M6_EUPED|nr:unnamed protein product [Euphydryas editha]